MAVRWIGPDEKLADFSTVSSFLLRIARKTSPAVFLIDKTTGFAANDGQAGPTNLTVTWVAGEIDVLPEGVYAGRIETGGKRPLLFTLKIGPYI